MATLSNQTFNDESIAVDDNRYEKCTFVNCTLVYSGGTLPVFADCKFDNSTIELGGAASNTITYLSGMYQGGLLTQVGAVVKDLQRGKLPGPEPAVVDNESVYTGTNFRQLGVYSGILVIITALLIIAYWYGAYWHPTNNILGGDVVQPLSSEIPLELMPILPDDLAATYDELNDGQRDQLAVRGWVDESAGIAHITIDDASAWMVANGAPEFAAQGE